MPWVDTVLQMLVADLHHFLDLPDDTPGPARRLAGHLSGIVRAATAGDAGTAWGSALPCRRRPGNRSCPGRMIVLRPEPPAAIHWTCSTCDDDGVISNWVGSPHDLRRRRLTLAGRRNAIAITDEVASALRDLRLPDADSERVVFTIRADGGRIVLTATDDELDALVGLVAAEANHEPNRRRQQRLDAAFHALGAAGSAAGG